MRWQVVRIWEQASKWEAKAPDERPSCEWWLISSNRGRAGAFVGKGGWRLGGQLFKKNTLVVCSASLESTILFVFMKLYFESSPPHLFFLYWSVFLETVFIFQYPTFGFIYFLYCTFVLITFLILLWIILSIYVLILFFSASYLFLWVSAFYFLFFKVEI